MTPEEHAKKVADLTEWVGGLEVVELTTSELNSLREYSSTTPTGKTIGKQWRRRIYYGDWAGTWVRGEYIEDPDPECVGMMWHRIEIKES